MSFGISFAVYTLLVVVVGLWSAKFAKRSDEDYFLAGRTLNPWVAALSASASAESGWVTIGLVGWAFTSGASAYWIVPGCLLGFLFSWLVMAGRLRVQSADIGALTVPDFLSMHFRERLPILRIMSVIVILVAMLLYVAAQFAAAGKAFAVSFDNVDYRVGVLIGAGIVLVYTVLGGFRAACWTDFLQGIIIIGALVLFPAYMLITNGGWTFIEESLANEPGMTTFWPEQTGMALIGFLLGSGALGINFGYPGQPHVLVRFMALNDPKDAKIGAVISAVWAGFVLSGAVTVGLICRAMTEAHAGDVTSWTAPLLADLQNEVSGAGETGLVLAAKNMIPGVFSGAVLAAVLAAICSTADSQLVVAASSVASDIYSRLMDKTGKLAHLLINRSVMIGLGVIAVLLVIDEQVKVYTYVLTYGWAILGASFGPQLILILIWKRASYAGCVAGMVAGFLTALLWQLLNLQQYIEFPVYNLVLAFVVALVTNVGVSLMTPR